MANNKRKSNSSAVTADGALEKGIEVIHNLMNSGEYKKALVKLERYEKKYPNHPLVILNRRGLHIEIRDSNSFFLAGDEGFEPPITGPEPGALPLGQSPIGGSASQEEKIRIIN